MKYFSKVKRLLQRLDRWFELNLGWMFIKGYKQDSYREYLKNKYGPKNYINGSEEYFKSYYEQMKERED
jgi:hypothetical protein